MTLKTVISRLEAFAERPYKEKMSHFGIDNSQAIGVRLPHIRQIAKEIKTDHLLALQLWKLGKHETRLLASMIADPKQGSPEEMEAWVGEIYSWDLCDQLCSNYWVHCEYWYQKAAEWVDREEEYVKRAGFVLIVAGLIKRKKLPDETFRPALAWMEKEAGDTRNFVAKAINWLLREMGKRRPSLRQEVFALAERLTRSDVSKTRWIGQNALAEFQKKGLTE
ncbi:MAG: DNA alkylation repair protein [Bacteroidetes bacterium]|nr:DNA alkylation repair protein [Bacteroidota bacterium]